MEEALQQSGQQGNGEYGLHGNRSLMHGKPSLSLFKSPNLKYYLKYFVFISWWRVAVGEVDLKAEEGKKISDLVNYVQPVNFDSFQAAKRK